MTEILVLPMASCLVFSEMPHVKRTGDVALCGGASGDKMGVQAPSERAIV